LPRARKERQIAPQALYRSGAGQASAGDPLSINSPLAIRKAQRGRDKKAPEKWQNPPPVGAIHESPVHEKYLPYDCKQSRQGGIFFQDPEMKGHFKYTSSLAFN